MEALSVTALFSTADRDFRAWVLANENTARVLAAKGYHCQFVIARHAVHVDRGVVEQTLAEARQYLWQDYPTVQVK